MWVYFCCYIFLLMIRHIALLYEFPIATVMNYHKLSGLRQHFDLLSYASGGENSKISFTGPEANCRPGWFLLEAVGENLFPCLFQHLAVPAIQDSGPFLNLLLPSSHRLLMTLTLLPPAYLDPCDSTGPTWISISKSLITSAKSLHSRVSGIGQTCLRGNYSVYHT